MASPQAILDTAELSTVTALTKSFPVLFRLIFGGLQRPRVLQSPQRQMHTQIGHTVCVCVDIAIAKMNKMEFSSLGVQANEGDVHVNSHKIMWPEDEIREEGTRSQKIECRQANHAGQRNCR